MVFTREWMDGALSEVRIPTTTAFYKALNDTDKGAIIARVLPEIQRLVAEHYRPIEPTAE